MSHIIEEVFFLNYTRICLQEKSKEITTLEEKLFTKMSSESDRELLSKLIDEYQFQLVDTERHAYQNGFKTGARLINEINNSST